MKKKQIHLSKKLLLNKSAIAPLVNEQSGKVLGGATGLVSVCKDTPTCVSCNPPCNHG